MDDVLKYYEGYREEDRLASGSSQLEFERTKEILLRHLPSGPARILDVGGAAGAYSLWLAALGHEVHLVDATPRLVEEARRRNSAARNPIASLRVADARNLPADSESFDVVLVMGPLYHLTDAADRTTAIAEVFRVLKRPGFAAFAAISRFASALDGLAQNFSIDPVFVGIRDRDVREGQHRNEGRHPFYFTTAYFHRPQDLSAELTSAGFDHSQVLGVEGPGWLLTDFDNRWADEAQRNVIVETARLLEAEPSIIGVSAHMLGLAWKR